MAEPDDRPIGRPIDEQPEILEEYNEGSQEVLSTSLSGHYETFQSPLLPPEIMKRYGEVIPGLETKLVDWTVEETQHRRQMEIDAFEEARALRKRAQFSGPLVGALSIIAAALIGLFNPTWAGSAIAIVLVIAGVGGPFAARLLAERWGSDAKSGDD